MNYAISQNTKIYVQAGNHDWKEEYFVAVTPWINGPAQTRFENKKQKTVFVGVTLNLSSTK